MFARSSKIHADPSMLDDGIAYVRHTVMPAMTHIDGFVGLSLMVDRDSGTCIATSGWRTEQALGSSAGRASVVRDNAAAALGGTSEVDEWQVAVMHRARHARPGVCMRATWSRADPSRLDELTDVFKFKTLSQIEDLPGFSSASLLVNPMNGRVVVTVGYESRETLAESREQGAAVRDETAHESQLEVLEVAEFDLEIAHLHIPETV